jgi:hypothetical protein
MTNAEAVENARENEALLGEEFGGGLPSDPTPEQAWAYVKALWEGDPGGRGWQLRVPAAATWLSLRDDEGDPARGGGRSPRSGSASRPWGRAPGKRPATETTTSPRRRRRFRLTGTAPGHLSFKDRSDGTRTRDLRRDRPVSAVPGS